jgi:hypothetical protein
MTAAWHQFTPRHILLLLAALAVGVAIPFLPIQDLSYLSLLPLIGAVIVLIGSVRLARQGTRIGFYLGVYAVGQHVIGHTYPAAGSVLWALSMLNCLVLFVIALQTRDRWLSSLRLGAMWLVPAVAVASVLGALAAGAVWIAQGRLATAVLFTLTVLVLRESPERQLRGLCAGAGMVFTLLLVAGFAAPHTVDQRFAGGAFAYTHPNLIGIYGALLAVCWLFLMDARWLRFAGILVFVGMLAFAQSRTSLGAFAIGAALGVPSWRLRLVLVLGGVAVLFLGSSFFLGARGDDTDLYTGRTLIWEIGMREWSGAGIPGKLLGPAVANVAGMLELQDGREFVAHNAFLSALVRGGAVGVACTIGGLLLLLWHAQFFLRRPATPIARASVSVIAVALATVQTEAFLTDGTVLWWIAAAEAVLVGGVVAARVRVPRRTPREPAALMARPARP